MDSLVADFQAARAGDFPAVQAADFPAAASLVEGSRALEAVAPAIRSALPSAKTKGPPPTGIRAMHG